MKKNKEIFRRRILNLCIAACLVFLLICVAKFAYEYHKNRSEQSELNEIAQIYHDNAAKNVMEGTAYPENVLLLTENNNREANGVQLCTATNGKTVAASKNAANVNNSSIVEKKDDSFLFLKRENSDFKCWITVSGAGIDYPVMQNESDSEYYLHRDFYKQYSYSGLPFMDIICEIDSDVVIIYAHNMKNGTMFGNLDLFRDKTFWADNSELVMGTESGDRTYRIFGAFETSIYESDFIYTDYAGKLNESEYGELVSQIRERTPYETGMLPKYGNKIVLLSTCSYHEDGGRYVVAAAEISGDKCSGN